MKELVMNSRDQLAVFFVVLAGCFLLFYWTHSAFETVRDNVVSETNVIVEKIAKVDELMKAAKSNTKRTQTVNTSLLAFMQNETSRFGLDTKMTVLKPKTAAGSKESATVRFEQFDLNDMLNLIGMVDQYENLLIDSFGVTKRFDDAELVNISMEISKVR